eukprot:882509-Amorphochlora_amoeboformis.AAC.2
MQQVCLSLCCHRAFGGQGLSQDGCAVCVTLVGTQQNMATNSPGAPGSKRGQKDPYQRLSSTSEIPPTPSSTTTLSSPSMFSRDYKHTSKAKPKHKVIPSTSSLRASGFNSIPSTPRTLPGMLQPGERNPHDPEDEVFDVEESSSSQDPFSIVYGDPIGRRCLAEFMRKIHAEENLHFDRYVAQFRRVFEQLQADGRMNIG